MTLLIFACLMALCGFHTVALALAAWWLFWTLVQFVAVVIEKEF